MRRLVVAYLVLLTSGVPSEEVASAWIFIDTKYHSTASAGYIGKCLPAWQDECRRNYGHDLEMRQQLCESHLERNYVKIRMQVPVEDIMDRWAKFKDWHDFDIGFYKAHAPQYTTHGFKRGKLPDDLHAIFHQWYLDNRHRAVPEAGETAFGLHCNTGHDNDDWIVPFRPESPELQEPVALARKYLMQLLSEWTGQDVNENTVVYGVRQYHRGSICGMHTDAPDTHAFGIVYHINAKNMDEPWAFNYVTHKGVEHKSFLKPGEIMMYEAATSLHGRKEPLRGDEFANLYFHFRSPQWKPGLEAWQKETYWTERMKYEEVYRESVGRPLYSDDFAETRRTFQSTNSCLPIRARGMPLMVEGHFMDIPPAEDYEYEDFKAMMESRGETKNGIFAPFTAAEATSFQAVKEVDVGSSFPFTQASVLVVALLALGVTVHNIFKTGRRKGCSEFFVDTHSA